jgi:hypothetical protein
MFFQRDAVFTALHGAPQWNPLFRLRSIHETEHESFDSHSDNTVIISIILSIKHNSSSRNARTNFRPHGGAGMGGRTYNQLKFIQTNARYDRIITMGDLNTPGKCFCIITETVAESDYLLRHMREYSTIGDIVAVVEPEGPKKALNDMPVVSTITPLVPLATPDPIPSIALVTPQPGYQRYFLLTSVTIQMSRVQVVDASCRGILCDRQQPPNRLVSCGCIFLGRDAALVLQCHLTFNYVDESGGMETHTVNNYRSYKTTKLFLTPITPTTDITPYFRNTGPLRASVTASLAIVNNNGGWNIAGWLRMGEVTDASSSQEPGSEVGNVNHPIHISYLYPSNADAVEQIKERRFTPAANDAE